MHKLFIIVLNWNGFNHTCECVHSLKKADFSNLDIKIVVVDNGSSDHSLSQLKEIFQDIVFIELEHNLGYTGGNNSGIRFALKEKADYVLLLNNDTIVHPNFARELMKSASGDQRAGFFCSKIFYYDKKDVIWYAGGWFNIHFGYGRHIGFGKNDSEKYNRIREVERPCGCAMMVSRKLCETVGLLNEDFFCYSEEIDWFLRARKHGFTCLYVPSSIIWHKISASTGGVKSALYLYYVTRNMLYCLNNNVPYQRNILNLLRNISVIITNIISLFTLNIPKVSGMKFIIRGTKDYYLKRIGKI